jgi:hypothetical protein
VQAPPFDDQEEDGEAVPAVTTIGDDEDGEPMDVAPQVRDPMLGAYDLHEVDSFY